MFLIYTNLGGTPFPIIVLVNAILFVRIISRMIPAQALMSAIPAAENRGSFISLNSSLQQMAGGMAAYLAGTNVKVTPDGHLQNFNVVGYVLVGTTLITTLQMYGINKRLATKLANPS